LISLGIGTYTYKVVLERRDSSGNIVRSFPSPAVSCTTTAINDYVIVSPYNALSSLTYGKNIYPENEWSYSIYRTLLSGYTYYRLPETGAFNDNYSDNEIRGNPQLYTNGNIMGNTQPPTSRFGTLYQNRLFLIDREQESTVVRYSKRITDGVGIEHNDALGIAVNSQGGRIYALASMDDKLYIFKAKSIYATYGKGLFANNSGVNYAEPYLISNAVGCINPDSIVNIPDGIIFESSDGIMLLTRGLRIVPIGEVVKYWYSLISISKAVHDKVNSEAIFLDSSSNGLALVFNYRYKTWSCWTNFRAESAEIVDNKVIYANSGIVRIQDESLVQDDTANMSMILEIGWIKISEYDQVRCLNILGQNISDSNVSVQMQYSYDPIWKTAKVYATSALENYDYTEHFGDGLSDISTNQNQALFLKAESPVRKCTAFRFRVTITSTGLGCDLSALGIALQTQHGAPRIDKERAF
jgi:hypothetical protein